MFEKQEKLKKAKESPGTLEKKRDPALEFEYSVIDLTEKWASKQWEEPTPEPAESEKLTEGEPEDKMQIFINRLIDPKSPSDYKTPKQVRETDIKLLQKPPAEVANDCAQFGHLKELLKIYSQFQCTKKKIDDLLINI